ncbi:MAG: arginine--tRNA ligase [Candidatus Altiarchaeota archaeon]
MIEGVKTTIRELVGRASGEDIQPDDIVESPVADYGCSIAFKLASKLKKNPADIARELADKIRPSGAIKKVEADGGYINFHLDYALLAKELLKTTLVEKMPPAGERIVLEHTSVNPSGPIHVGRLRNTIIGDSLKRILDFCGYDVETHYFVNDVGKQIAIIALGLEGKLEPDSQLVRKYEHYSRKEDFIVFFSYVTANKKFEEEVEFQKLVQEIIYQAENGDKNSLNKIKKAAQKCLNGQKETFDRLNVKFDYFDFESDCLLDGSVRTILQKLKKNRLWTSSEVGGGLDLSNYGLERKTGFTVLERADGTTVYLSRDLAYHLKKAELGAHLINVLGEDHKMQFQELKTILVRIFELQTRLDAVHYSFVSFEGSKLSTRRGQIASVDELLDEAVEKAENEVKKRGIAGDDVAEMIGAGAVKFHIIKTSPNKPITFIWKDALSFEGETGPYIQYAHARSCRILEKSGIKVEKIKPAAVSFELENNEEKALVRTLSDFHGTVKKAASELRPDILASYMIKLTADYGRFYIKCPVLDASEDVRARRLLLVAKAKNTLGVGLGLLGISAPERM